MTHLCDPRPPRTLDDAMRESPAGEGAFAIRKRPSRVTVIEI